MGAINDRKDNAGAPGKRRLRSSPPGSDPRGWCDEEAGRRRRPDGGRPPRRDPTTRCPSDHVTMKLCPRRTGHLDHRSRPFSWSHG